ncbi:MAG: hypothetical protein WCY11_19770 [Novosphingobium sp.]
MARITAFAASEAHRIDHVEALRRAVVCACALALIFAGQALPG